MNIIERITSFITPHRCLGCGEEGALFCAACTKSLPIILSRCYICTASTDNFRTCTKCRKRSRLTHVWAATSYDGYAKDLVWRLKFARARAAAEDIARAMVAQLPIAEPTICITHVPTASGRIRMRGYDQAQLIAKSVAERKGYSYIPLLTRYGQQRQVGTSRAERRRQLDKGFAPIRPHALANKHILLIDDVLTTGSTLESAAAVLRAAGAARVSAAVFAAA